MLPLTFDRRVLSSPLLDYDDAAGRVLKVLRAIVERRVLPGLAEADDVDPVQIARASERYSLSRLEDTANGLELVSLVAAREGGWTVHIHERVFDYFAFGLPLNPAQAFEDPTREARKVLALAEFLLRHEFDHIVRPHCEEVEILAADCGFVSRCRESEHTFHHALMEAMEDSTNGLRTGPILELFRRFERAEGFEDHARAIVHDHVPPLCGVPERLLTGAFVTMARAEKELLLDACYRRATDPSLPLARRAGHLSTLLALFGRQRREDVGELRELFDAGLKRWPVKVFLRELEVEGADLDQGNTDQLFERFVRRLASSGAGDAAEGTSPKTQAPRLEPSLDSPLLVGETPKPAGTLRDRIEAARLDPLVPRSVIRAIDNNIDNIEGHSKAKYTEFIETLLTVPWGRIRPIEVGPREFAAGLDASHFGLDQPKELVTDFFTNLIWRYRDFDEERSADWHRSGSSFLFVGPPGVGKTSLAISIARNLGIPYHKVSLGGMRDESALRGHGFTYEGSKPGAIVQGLIKMGSMNGMFILDETDKTEAFAIATLLEILDPEQNHLFHDKYTLTTVDIDLSNCHFILTANTLDTVPAPVIDRCQVVQLDRYSVEEKIEIARRHILPRLRERHDITAEMIDFEPDCEQEHLRFLIQHYTHEAGVRQLELVLRTLLLRLQRRHLFEGGLERVEITHHAIRSCLEEPAPPATINPEDRVGEMLALGVNAERGVGGVIPVQATRIPGADDDRPSAVSMVHATGNLEKVMDESRRVATTAILHCADLLGIAPERVYEPVHLHFMGGSTRKDGPSAGVAIALSLASLLSGRALRRDVAATGEIDTHGRITGVGGLDVKLETAVNAGCKTLIIPRDNLTGPGGVERLPEALRSELQVLSYDQWRGDHEPFDPDRHTIQLVSVDHIVQALDIAMIDQIELEAAEETCVQHAREVAAVGDRRQRCPLMLVIKGEDELAEGHFASGVCAGCAGCELLVPTSEGRRITERLVRDGGRGRVREIEPGPESLRTVVRELVAEHGENGGPVVVVAPFFALREAALESLGLPKTIVPIANNFVTQGYKLKGSKPSLNRAICRLMHLEPRAVDSFPLLVRRDGIFVADLGLVPEKYRLDPGRCEELLNRLIGAWLAEFEGIALKPN
jgi:ATP-dependent Lon protease